MKNAGPCGVCRDWSARFSENPTWWSWLSSFRERFWWQPRPASPVLVAQSGLSQLLDSWNVLGKSWLLRQDGIRLRVPRVFGWFARLRPDVLHDARLRNHFLVCVGPRSTIQFIYRLQVDRLVKGKMPSVGVNNEVFWCKWQRNLYVDCCQAGRAVERRELVCVRVKHYGRIVRRNEASGVVRYEYRRDHVEKHRS